MPFSALRAMIREHRGVFVVATALRVAASMLPALHPYFVARLATSDGEDVGQWLILLFGTGVAHLLLWTAGDFFNAKQIVPLTYEFKRRTFTAVWAEPYQRFVDRPSGKVASYVNDLRDHTQALWEAAHYGFLPVLSTIPVYIVLLAGSSAGNAAAYVVFLVVAGVVMTAVGRPVNTRQRRVTDRTSNNTGRVFDSYANFVNVFSFRAQRKEVRRNDDDLDGLIKDDVSFTYALSAYWGVASVLVRILLWGVIMGVSWWQFDRGSIGLVAMVVSITVLLDFTNQYWEVVYNLGEWINRSASYREAYGYLFPDRNVVSEPATQPLADPEPGRLHHTIEVRDLCFAYPDEPDRMVLDGISFTLRRGERLGIVGRSGEGKSTLIKILLGFYEPTSGEVLVDGHPADGAELATLHSYVPQDTSLFQETVEYNIGYASGGPVDHDAVRRAASRANIGEFIESLPDGYRTLVGERGIKLSLGQRQRIAIARAFLKQSDLVILDEATSALDSETEAKIRESLVELWQDRAAIVIAHRLATLNDMDRIMVIEHGRIAEQGTRDELIDADGRFADMWGLQRAGLN
ncbi:MAG: ATP-binding cassette subfamily B protein [Candidatus Aldehydirespiratoraceae bacterium]|jgi:ATP-binding cassette subfamily B protein